MAACSVADGDLLTIQSSPGEPEGPRPNEARGVHNPRVVDLVGFDRESDQVYLLMVENRPWGSEPAQTQLRQIENKFNAYLAYVLDGHLCAQYPQYEGKPVRVQLDCVSVPGDEEIPFLSAVHSYAANEGIEFVVNVVASESHEADGSH